MSAAAGAWGRLLTLAVAAQVQHHYAVGALFVPLAAITDPALVAPTLLSALNVPDGSTKLPQTRLIEHLRRKELLLVLDNFEQLLAAVSFVAELLATCPGLHILVTSRERLHLRAEQRYKVQPLPLPAVVDLFVQRATAVNVDFELTPAQRPTLEAICQRLDRLPLAIELCAAQIDLLPPDPTPGPLAGAPLRSAGGRRPGFAAATAYVTPGDSTELYLANRRGAHAVPHVRRLSRRLRLDRHSCCPSRRADSPHIFPVGHVACADRQKLGADGNPRNWRAAFSPVGDHSRICLRASAQAG